MALEETRQAALGDVETMLGQSGLQFMQEDARPSLIERQDLVGMGFDPMRALISTHGLGCDMPLTRKQPAPAARAGKANPEAYGCLMPRGPGCNGPDNTFTQIDGQS